MPAQLQTISGKLLVTITIALTMLVVGFTTFMAWRVSSEVKERVLEQSTLRASEISQRVGAQLTEATSAATALGGALSGLLRQDEVAASEVVNLLKGVAEPYGTGFFSWMAAVPGGAIEGLIVGDEGVNAEGVFAPYWTKTTTGELVFEAMEFEPDSTSEWYHEPIVSGHSVITEPYLFNGERLLTSVGVPVYVGDEIAAVAGIDIELNNLADFVNGLSVYEGGQVMLVGQSGKWLAHSNLDLITQTYEDPGAEALTIAIESGEIQVVSELPDGVTRLFYPFTAFGMNKTWVVVVDVPRHVFVTPVRQRIQDELITSGLLLIMTLVTIFFSTRSMVRRPIAKMMNAVNALSEGRVHEPVDLPKSKDEIGIMAVSIETLREGLAEKEGLEVARKKEQVEQENVVRLLAEGLQQLAAGNLNAAIKNELPGQYEQLRRDFNASIENLNGTVSQVVASAESIRNGAAEISQSSDDLSRRTESQAATLEETAAALDELTASVKSAAESARNVENITEEAKQEAEASGQVVQTAISAMTEIEQSSTHISQIIGVIDDIAFQTNLLALNAGVEAARAGESGRGFAVVASEVRALAQRSSDAAMEIKRLIGDSSKQVERGVDLVGKAGEALTNIADRVNHISRLVSDIAEGAVEQSTGLGEINAGVVQLDQVTQQNAAMVEQATAAGHMLNTDAGKLVDMVAHFKLSDAPRALNTAPALPPSQPTAHGEDDWGIEEMTPAPVAASGGNAAKGLWQDF
ncbi:MAG: HAMP domain-containing protein [Rhodobacteraceae bacterium]|nr:HAMP domain-containing protein [Paracoccaceae bacterium]